MTLVTHMRWIRLFVYRAGRKKGSGKADLLDISQGTSHCSQGELWSYKVESGVEPSSLRAGRGYRLLRSSYLIQVNEEGASFRCGLLQFVLGYVPVNTSGELKQEAV